jgi:hypothetical protein
MIDRHEFEEALRHFESLNATRLDSEGEDESPPQKQTRQRVGRLRPLPGPHVRVPMQWILKPHRESPFTAEAALFLLILYRSHWGQRGVKLTDAVAAELQISPRTRRQALSRLESKGWVRVEHRARLAAPTVWPMVLAG